VQLKDGEAWTYTPPASHGVAWVFAQSGQLQVSGQTLVRELAVFEEGTGELTMQAQGDCAFLLGSAAKRLEDLVLGPYSVHSTPAALAAGHQRIQALGTQLQAQGRLG
jgi:redox-sensitive bicupin YhaK (pirin superfamily)